MRNKPTKPKLLASKFIKWYFNDHDEVISLGNSMRHLLETTGQCSLSMEELFDNCNYIPKYLCEIEPTKDMYSTDYDINEVELINDFN